VSLNWLNTKMVGLFVGCAILFVGFAIYDNLHIYKPLAKRFEWASRGLRGQATYGGALCSASWSGLRPFSATFCRPAVSVWSPASGEIR
jgi:hypothetical protein